MIPISAETYFELFLGFILLLGIVMWSYYAWHQYLEKWEISEEKLCRCKNCSLTYIIPRCKTESICTRCGERNTSENELGV